MEELLSLIQGELRIERQIEATTPLLSSGLVDSLNVVVLLTAIEERYELIIDEEIVGVETFDTPVQILDHIEMATRR